MLNAASDAAARESLGRCCGSRRWIERMLAARPYASSRELLARSDEIWDDLTSDDHLEAFAHHPQIGAELGELERRFGDTARWASQEQAGASQADRETLEALREDNLAYAAHFGFIFIVCATGKSAAEMLALLRARLPNDRETELRVAAEEQAKITKLRLEKLA
ncbi:MAG: 2-oxo-4-hydroxy-4-carboxy-5-ureidoimidazoline decarboxylase [Deltaproteobacteria bacterium]|nr:2-oxo-4-hydroxy-4-carboxy-5-ureidoimidazoline decarboxylase [Deltaproteobacteria bacterium]